MGGGRGAGEPPALGFRVNRKRKISLTREGRGPAPRRVGGEGSRGGPAEGRGVDFPEGGSRGDGRGVPPRRGGVDLPPRLKKILGKYLVKLVFYSPK